jgi:hypothetical protein
MLGSNHLSNAITACSEPDEGLGWIPKDSHIDGPELEALKAKGFTTILCQGDWP